jgi:hypothetical protein
MQSRVIDAQIRKIGKKLPWFMGIQKGWGAKSFKRKVFLIHEENARIIRHI